MLTVSEEHQEGDQQPSSPRGLFPFRRHARSLASLRYGVAGHRSRGILYDTRRPHSASSVLRALLSPFDL